MSISKAEGVALGAGAVALLGSFVFGRNWEPHVRANARIFGVGALLTGGAMFLYRRHRLMRQLSGSGLGLHESSSTHADGKTLRVWDDRTMGIKERVYLLQGLVAKGAQDPTMRKLGLAITGHGKQSVQIGDAKVSLVGAACPARDDVCEAKAIYDWVSANIRYTGDTGAHALGPGGPVEAVDEFQSAPKTIEFRGGDCDDHAVLNATLAIKNGFPAKFRITSNYGDSWDHIYAMVGVPKLNPTRWIALDTTLGDPGRGAPVNKFNKQPRRAKQVDFAA